MLSHSQFLMKLLLKKDPVRSILNNHKNHNQIQEEAVK